MQISGSFSGTANPAATNASSAMSKLEMNLGQGQSAAQTSGAISKLGSDNGMSSNSVGGIDLGSAKSGVAGFDADATRIDLIA